jgi:hypothetical protein
MQLSIQKDRFLIDGRLSYSDFPGVRPQALGRLMNCRMVQATFEDENPKTAHLFRYPDGAPFDADRQTDEFIAALPEYRRHGVIAATLNFQGGYPLHHKRIPREEILQKWENNAYTSQGALKGRYATRMQRIIETADALGMVVIVGLFYFGQNHKLANEQAIKRATAEAVAFLASLNRGNVMIEINNECDVPAYVHEILQPHRVHELIKLARKESSDRFPVSTSYAWSLPDDNVLEAVRARSDKPIVFNEDFNLINLPVAWECGASWGYYEQGRNNYRDGFQCPPTNWGINTLEKRAFFQAVAELVGVDLSDEFH